jgi:hypothetical protein
MRALTCIVLAATGCHSDSPSISKGGLDPESPSIGPILVGGSCGAFTPGPLPVSESLRNVISLANCLPVDDERLKHAVPEFYDSCDPHPWTPLACAPLPYGQQFCEGGRWTVICKSDQDCGPAARCYWGEGVGRVPDSSLYGTCERACTGSGFTECIRCDMQCDLTLGICRKASSSPEAGPPCTADCECSEGKCILGQCYSLARSARLGICSHTVERTCECIGGTCREDGCCVLPDGTIDPGTGPACRP